MSDVPRGWAIKRLMDLVRIPNGQVDPRVDPFRSQVLIAPDHLVPGSGGITRRETAESQSAISGKFQIFPGDVLYSKIRPALRKAALIDFPGICSADVYPLRSSGGIDPRYLLNVILSDRFSKFAESVSGRSGIPKINRTELEEFWLPLPPMTEQRRIAKILDTVDQVIRSSDRLIAKLEQARHGLLQDLLTCGAEVTGCLNDLSDGGLQPSSLGLIPLGWRVTALGDLGPRGVPVLRTGPFGSSLKGEDWVSSGVPVITIGSLGEGILDYDELLFISENKAAILAAYRVRAGEIVFSRVADVGRSVVALAEHEGWVMSSNLMKITLDSSRAAPDYVQLALAYDPRVRKQLRSTVNSSGRDVVSGSIVKALLIPLPPVEEQRRICAIASQGRTSIKIEADLLAKLHLLKQGLMDDLLTGRVRVGASA